MIFERNVVALGREGFIIARGVRVELCTQIEESAADRFDNAVWSGNIGLNRFSPAFAVVVRDFDKRACSIHFGRVVLVALQKSVNHRAELWLGVA